MAKIVLISKSLDATTIQLAVSLKNQQNEVTIVTSKSEQNSPETNQRREIYQKESLQGIETLYFYEQWTMSETLRMIPLLLYIKPNVIHLVLQKAQINFGQALWGIIAKSLPHCVLSLTLLEIKNGLSRRNLTRYFVEHCDVVTCPHLEALGELRGLNIKAKQQKRSILPPVLELFEKKNENYRETIDQGYTPLWDLFSKYLIIPFFESSFNPQNSFWKRFLVLVTYRPVILWGTYEHWSVRDRRKFLLWASQNGLDGRWAVTGELSESENENLLKMGSYLILAGADFYPQEFVGYVNQAVLNKIPLVIDSQQAHLHAEIWRNGENCWIWDKRYLNRDLQNWIHLKNKTLSKNLDEFIKHEEHLLDSPFNELNRMYVSVLK